MAPENDLALVGRMISDGFARIDNSLESIRRTLEGKADIGSVKAVETNLDLFKRQVDERFKPLEETRTEGITLGKVAWAIIGTVGVAVFLAGATILSALISGGHL